MVPPTVCGVGSSKSRVVSGKQKWGRRSPAAVRCFESASKLAHSKRFATSETPCGSAAAHGLLRLAAAVGDERGWKPALQRDAISTGGSRAAWSWSYRRAVARAKRWPSRVVCGNTRSGWTIGVRNRTRMGRAVGRWIRAWREHACAVQRTGQFWARATEEALLGLDTFWRNRRRPLLPPRSRPAKGSKN